MYAETFKVPQALEGPAKWARWAQQSLSARKLKDTEHNLQQFWQALQPFKAQAQTAAQWAPLLTLDSFCQFALAGVHQARQIEVLQELNAYISTRNASAKMALAGFPPVAGLLSWSWWNSGVAKAMEGVINWAHGSSDAYVRQSKERLETHKRGAEEAMKRSQAMAQQAKEAEAKARTGGAATVASNLVSLTATGPQQVSGWNQITGQASNRLTQTQTPGQAAGTLAREGVRTVAEAAGGLLGSTPWWVWAAGGLALALLLTRGGGGPAVVLSEMRRRAA